MSRHAVAARIAARIATPALLPLLGILVATGSTTPGAASQEPSIAGRWRSEQPALTLDIARCRAGWCGVTVEPDGRCGAQVLTAPGIASMAALGTDDPTGRLVVPGQPAWAVRISLAQPTPAAAAQLVLVGVEPSLPHAFMRRIFPFRAVMARLGDAACAPPVS